MKFLSAVLISVMVAEVLPAAGEMPTAQVTLPYSEFRSLIDCLKKPEAPNPPEPVVPFAVLSSRFVLVADSSSVQGTVTFEVQSFSEKPQLVPLIGDVVTIRKVAPDGATVLQNAGFYNLLIAGAKRQTVTLEVGWAGREEEGTVAYHCPVAPAVISEVEIGKLPEGVRAEVADAVRDGNRFHLGSRDMIALRLRKPQDKPSGEVVPMPPVVAAAESEMRVVRDGTFFNSTTRNSAAAKPRPPVSFIKNQKPPKNHDRIPSLRHPVHHCLHHRRVVHPGWCAHRAHQSIRRSHRPIRPRWVGAADRAKPSTRMVSGTRLG